VRSVYTVYLPLVYHARTTHPHAYTHRDTQRHTEIHRYARTLTHTHTERERHKHPYCVFGALALALNIHTYTHTATPSTQRYTQKYTEIHRGTRISTRCIYTPHTYKSIVVLFYLHNPNCELYVYMVYTFIYSILFNRLLYSNCVSKTKQRNNVILRYICMYLEILCFV